MRIWSLADNTVKVFAGHEGTVWAVALSPDGKVLASSGDDKKIKLWNTETGELIHDLVGHSLNVWSIKINPDGRQLASGSFDKELKLWDIESGKLIRTLSGHTEAIVAVDYNANGRIVASASDDETVKLWNSANGELIRSLSDGNEHVQAVDFSRLNKWLICGGRDKGTIGELLQNFLGESHHNGVSMRLWDIETGKLLQTFTDHKNDVNDVAFSPDGNWIASASSDYSVRLYKRIK